jgi:hypothetical protein
MATRLGAHQCSTSNQISLTDTDMGRQLCPSGRQGYNVRMQSLIRPDVEKNCNRSDVRSTPSRCGPYYGNYVKQMYNRLDSRATPSERILYMKSVKRVMESRLHSFPSGLRQLASGCLLEKSKLVSI